MPRKTEATMMPAMPPCMPLDAAPAPSSVEGVEGGWLMSTKGSTASIWESVKEGKNKATTRRDKKRNPRNNPKIVRNNHQQQHHYKSSPPNTNTLFSLPAVEEAESVGFNVFTGTTFKAPSVGTTLRTKLPSVRSLDSAS